MLEQLPIEEAVARAERRAAERARFEREEAEHAAEMRLTDRLRCAVRVLHGIALVLFGAAVGRGCPLPGETWGLGYCFGLAFAAYVLSIVCRLWRDV